MKRIKNTLPIIFVGFLAIPFATHSADSWVDFAGISPTATFEANHLCYSDGRDLGCGDRNLYINAAGEVGLQQSPQTGVSLGVSGSIFVNHSGSNTALRIGDPLDLTSETAIYLRSTTKGEIRVGSDAALTFTSGGGSKENMRIIHQSGNVGIATVSPTTKLDVSGTIRISDGGESAAAAGAGAIKYDTGDLYVSDGSTWSALASASGVGASSIDELSDGKYLGQSVYLGAGAGDTVTTTTDLYNVAVGQNALYSNISGSTNTASGANAMYYNTTGRSNAAFGTYSLLQNTTGRSNSAFGYQALLDNTSGNQNAAFGNGALYHLTTGSGNTALGMNAGTNIADGSTPNETPFFSVYVGSNTKALADGGNNEIVIGYGATGLGSNSVVLGNDDISTTALKGKVGIGTTNPSSELDVLGSIATSNFGGTSTSSGLHLYKANGTESSPSHPLNSSTLGLITFWGHSDYSSSAVKIDSKATAAWSDTNAPANLRFFTRAENTPSAQLRMLIKEDGRVGVGTASPSTTLDVSGSLRVADGGETAANAGAGAIKYDSGDLYVSDGSTWSALANASGVGASSIDELSDARYVGQSVYLGTGAGDAVTVTTDLYNTAIGYGALNANTTGGWNTATGNGALYSNTLGNANTAHGRVALFSNTTGQYNLGNGYGALYSNTTGNNNTANGYHALYSNTIGNDNIANGLGALYRNTSGSNNTVNGRSALYANTTGSNNTANGHRAGRYIADGSTDNETSNNSLYLGANTKALADGGDNEIVIGYNATGLGDNSVVLGNDSIVTTALKGNVGINTTSPSETFHLHNGNFRISRADTSYLQLKGSGDGLYDINIQDSDAATRGQMRFFRSTSTSGTVALDVLKGDNTTTVNSRIGGNQDSYLNADNGLVGIGTSSPGVQLDVAGTLKIADGGETASAAGAGAIKYDTGSLYFSDGSTWAALGSGGGGGAGSIDDLSDGKYLGQSIYLGANAGYSVTITSNLYNTAVGVAALTKNTIGSNNIALGYQTLSDNTTGDNNVATGYRALYTNTVGANNVALGYMALYDNSTGTHNTAIGARSMWENTEGLSNTATGYQALYRNTTGDLNVAYGASALRSNLTGDKNTAIGASALDDLSTGANNLASGFYALGELSTGSNNLASGYEAGRYRADGTTQNTSLNDSVFLGAFTKTGASSATNEIVIGYHATGLGHNSVVLGNDSINRTALKGKVGIGTTSPATSLDVSGTLKIADGGETASSAGAGAIKYDTGALYFSDGSTWTTLATGSGGASSIDELSDARSLGSSIYLGTASGATIPDATDLYNTAVGIYALNANTSGDFNTASGYAALLGNTTGQYNSAFGYQALTANTSGVANSAFGLSALRSNTVGNYNAGFGQDAGRYIADGSTANATSVNSTYLGTSTRALADGGNNEIVIGYNTTGLGSNSVVLGNDDIATTALKGNVGIGTTSPSGTLHLVRSGSGDVLTFSRDGNILGSINTGGPKFSMKMRDGYDFRVVDSDGTTALAVNEGTKHVGILTNASITPTVALEVSGSIRISDGGETAANAGAGAIKYDTGSLYFSNGSSWAALAAAATTITMISDLDGDTNIQVEESSDEDIIRFDVQAKETMVLNRHSTGNHSINLDLISTSSTASELFRVSNSTGSQNHYYGAGSESQKTIIGNDIWQGYVAITPQDTEVMRINYDGTVGIGTTTIDDDLHIKETGGHATLKLETTGDGNTSGIFFSRERNDGEDHIGGAIGLVSNTAGHVTQLFLNARSSNASEGVDGSGIQTPFLTLGNGISNVLSVGVGTTSPTVALDVSGTLRVADGGESAAAAGAGAIKYASGSLYFSDGSTWAALGSGGGGASSIDDLSDAKSVGQSVYLGSGAGAAVTVTTDLYNTAVGVNSLLSTTTGGANTAIGKNSLSSNTIGNNNIAIGGSALRGNIEGEFNTALGFAAGRFLTDFSTENTAPNNSIFLGARATSLAVDNINQIVIGYNATGLGDHSVVIGNDDIVTTALKGKVGIGTTTPASQFHLAHSGSGGAVLSIEGGSATAVSNLNFITLGDKASGLGNSGIKGWNFSARGNAYATTAQQNSLVASFVNSGSISNVLSLTAAGNIGIGTATPAANLDVVGDIQYTGTLTDASDRRLKTDIQPLTQSIDEVLSLAPVSFKMKDNIDITEYGFIAQDVEKIFPNLVSTADDVSQTKSLNYVGLIAPMVKAIKDLKEENDALKAQLSTFEERLKALENK